MLSIIVLRKKIGIGKENCHRASLVSTEAAKKQSHEIQIRFKLHSYQKSERALLPSMFTHKEFDLTTGASSAK